MTSSPRLETLKQLQAQHKQEIKAWQEQMADMQVQHLQNQWQEQQTLTQTLEQKLETLQEHASKQQEEWQTEQRDFLLPLARTKTTQNDDNDDVDNNDVDNDDTTATQQVLHELEKDQRMELEKERFSAPGVYIILLKIKD